MTPARPLAARPRAILAFVLMFLFVFLVACPRSEVRGGPRGAEFDARVRDLIARNGLGKARVGVRIAALPGCTESASVGADRGLVPASNVKLVTTAAALRLLGPEYRFVTTLYRMGDVADGVLQGHLAVVGSGDPSISGRFHDGNPRAVFQSWAAALKQWGVRRVAGKVYLDDFAFDRELTPPDWPDRSLTDWYQAQSGALSLNDNCIDITVSPGRPGAPAVVSLNPPTRYVNLINECVTTTSRTQHGYGFVRLKGTNTIRLGGKVWAKSPPRTESVTIHDPTAYFGTVLVETLRESGIEVGGLARLDRKFDPEAAGVAPVAQAISTLGQAVGVANGRSQNFYAEQILKALGRARGGMGSRAAGLGVVRGYLSGLGIAPGTYVQADGCGLSKANRFSAWQITRILCDVVNSPQGDVFLASLAVSGGPEGTLRKRLTQPPYRGAVRAKTGYVADASALSGYVLEDGRPAYAFSILVNGFTDLGGAKNFEDAVCRMLVDAARAEAGVSRR